MNELMTEYRTMYLANLDTPFHVTYPNWLKMPNIIDFIKKHTINFDKINKLGVIYKQFKKLYGEQFVDFQFISFDSFKIVIHYPCVTISNSHGFTHNIVDLYVELSHKMVLSGFRGSLTTFEASVFYQHSHLTAGYINSSFCLGDSDLKKQLIKIKDSQPNEQSIGYLKLLLDAYVAHESLEGTPYINAKIIYEKQECVLDVLHFNISDNLLSLPYTLTLIEGVWVKVIPNKVTDKLFQSNDFCVDVFNKQLVDVDGSVKLNTNNIEQFTNRKMGYFKDKPITMQITLDTTNKTTELHKVYQNYFLIELEKKINLKLWKNQ